MKKVRIIFIIFLLISCFSALSGQDIDYMSKIRSSFDKEVSSTNHSNYFKNANNPLEFIFGALFYGYKNFVSSQDMGSCVFHPSCSVYAIQSIKKKGVFFGSMSAFDRLTRCHPFSKDKYPLDNSKNHLYDPVD